jgi:hypothetical protein
LADDKAAIEVKSLKTAFSLAGGGTACISWSRAGCQNKDLIDTGNLVLTIRELCYRLKLESNSAKRPFPRYGSIWKT